MAENKRSYYARRELRRTPEEHRSYGYDYSQRRVAKMPRDKQFRYDALVKKAVDDLGRLGIQPSDDGWKDNPHVRAAALVPWEQRPVAYLHSKEDVRMIRQELREEQTFNIRYDLLCEIVRCQWDAEARTYYWIRSNHNRNRGNFDNSVFADAAKALGVTSRTISAHVKRLVDRGWVVRMGIGRYRFISQDKLAARHTNKPSPVIIRARVSDLGKKQLLFTASLKAEIHRTHKSTRLVTPHPLTGSDQAVLPRAGIASLMGFRPETISRRTTKAVKESILVKTPTAKELLLDSFDRLKTRLPQLRKEFPGGRLIGATSKFNGQGLFIAPGPSIYSADGMVVSSKRIPADLVKESSAYIGVPIAFAKRHGPPKPLRMQYCPDEWYPMQGTSAEVLYKSLDFTPNPHYLDPFVATIGYAGLDSSIDSIVSSLYYKRRMTAVMERTQRLTGNTTRFLSVTKTS